MPLVRKNDLVQVAAKRAFILAFMHRHGCAISEYAMQTFLARRYVSLEALLRDLKRYRIFHDLGF